MSLVEPPILNVAYVVHAAIGGAMHIFKKVHSLDFKERQKFNEKILSYGIDLGCAVLFRDKTNDITVVKRSDRRDGIQSRLNSCFSYFEIPRECFVLETEDGLFLVQGSHQEFGPGDQRLACPLKKISHNILEKMETIVRKFLSPLTSLINLEFLTDSGFYTAASPFYTVKFVDRKSEKGVNNFEVFLR